MDDRRPNEALEQRAMCLLSDEAAGDFETASELCCQHCDGINMLCRALPIKNQRKENAHDRD